LATALSSWARAVTGNISRNAANNAANGRQDDLICTSPERDFG
jgi:hypothetical protein